MRSPRTHLALFALIGLAIVGCDTRLAPVVKGSNAPPEITIDSPLVNSKVNLGDSILVHITATAGGHGITTINLGADAITGVVELGTYEETPRFKPITVELTPGTTDTTIRRYLQPIDLGNETLDSLVVFAILTDSIGLADTARVSAVLVSGPKVTILSPAANDSVTPNLSLSVTAEATDEDGIREISIIIASVDSAVWGGLSFADTITQAFGGTEQDVTFTASKTIPLGAPGRARIRIQAVSKDGVLQEGASAPMTLFVRSAASVSAPHVTQVVPVRAERTDTVVVTASGAGIDSVGLIVTDLAGAIVFDTAFQIVPATSNVKKGIAMALPVSAQGKTVNVMSYAVDQSGRHGYSVRLPSSPVETDPARAWTDRPVIVYGTTYQLPLAGTIGDLAVDPTLGQVFLSNTVHNRLEVWQNEPKKFIPNGVPVGSLPWGLFVSATNDDTLLVANSGGTNISRVYIGDTVAANLKEDLPHRILTRNVFIRDILESRDASTNRITASLTEIKSFSDRPQYIAQSTTGRVYFSTRPTSTAPEGSIRYIETDPAFEAPDPRLIWNYIETTGGTDFRYTIFNVDSIGISTAPANSLVSDEIIVFDHPYGKLNGTICVNARDRTGVLLPGCVISTVDGRPTSLPDPSVLAVIRTMAFNGSDIDYGVRLDLTQLPLKDTTFVAASFDNHWFAFGEGNSAPGTTGARIIMIRDSISAAQGDSAPQFLSPRVTVRDLTENAAERVFGLALDKSGTNIIAHGLESYLSEIGNPFHLRLQGKYNSLDAGAGIAMHPEADGRFTSVDSRLAFVASATGEIEAVDIAYFINRGRFTLKYPIYGPLRASKPMPGDDPTIILKLFALTQRGLVVVDVTQADIKPGPP
jgi:hypothetical protein